MKDYAREENGGQVVMASCGDERFPPENMLDGKDSTYWVTTGMFPQEFVLKLDSCIRVSKITTLSMNGELAGAGDWRRRRAHTHAARQQLRQGTDSPPATVTCSLLLRSAQASGGEVRLGKAGPVREGV